MVEVEGCDFVFIDPCSVTEDLDQELEGEVVYESGIGRHAASFARVGGSVAEGRLLIRWRWRNISSNILLFALDEFSTLGISETQVRAQSTYSFTDPLTCIAQVDTEGVVRDGEVEIRFDLVELKHLPCRRSMVRAKQLHTKAK